MKVNIDHTIEVSDEQRVQIANVLDGKVSKRQATREEMKTYLWDQGSDWEMVLHDAYLDLAGGPAEGDADEDLLGTATDEDDEMSLI